MMSLAPAVALALSAMAGAEPDRLPSIPFESFKLSNGLNVILSEDHTAPIVAVDVHYDVGSKDENPGRTGFAHLFEHLMFEGSEHLPKGEADRLIENVGGSANGATAQDQTVYWEQVPSNALEQSLFIESDRMGWLLPTLDQAKLDNQREVVLNERRQNYEMQPYGTAQISLVENLWNPDFPYHWLPIGSPKDVTAATLRDVREFFERWYGPNNASLAIAGDFDPRTARQLVEKWFGSIPPSPPPEHRAPQPKPLTQEKRITLEDSVGLPRLYVAWQTPKVFAPGDAELDMLAAILAEGKSARLVRRLVMDERIAQSVSAGQESQRLASMFVVVATPKPGHPVSKLLAEIDEEIDKLKKEPPAPIELERAVNKEESQAIFGLEPVGGFSGRASSLNRYYFETGDPGYFPKDIGRYRALKPEGLRAAAAKYLRKDARVVLTVVPRGGSAAAGRSAASPGTPKADPSKEGVR
ncbi:MAG TPA: pitrilysin family protein [Anaeromyxobacteraceae bacterium]|nr:pitrilysin family protein [Anaeromyxobacteraceae bacterium]